MAVKLGVLADIQFADKDSIERFGATLNYRGSRDALARAVAVLNAATDVAFVVQLGDFIDGFAGDEEKSKQDLANINAVFSTITHKKMHVLGNHDLNVPREHLHSELGLHDKAYFYEDVPNWRVVVLDTQQVSVSWPEDTPNHREAATWLQQNADKPNCKTWNGALGSTQLQWLEATLADAAARGLWALLCMHIPANAQAASEEHLIFDRAAFLSVLQAHPCVVAVLCGHYHPGGYHCLDGVHHVVLKATLECTTTAFAIAHLHPNGTLCLEGHGEQQSFELHPR